MSTSGMKIKGSLVEAVRQFNNSQQRAEHEISLQLLQQNL